MHRCQGAVVSSEAQSAKYHGKIHTFEYMYVYIYICNLYVYSIYRYIHKVIFMYFRIYVCIHIQAYKYSDRQKVGALALGWFLLAVLHL